jgi:ABC-2 type transport system ATP-binding protein
MDAIRIENACKLIKNLWTLKDISATFESGKIHGLIGKNGAGKTMLLKSICGLTRLTSGAIYVEGKKVGVDVDIPDSIGAIIEIPGFLPNLSGFNNLKYLAKLRNRIGIKEIKEAIEAVGLNPLEKKHVGKYSLGMRQRLGIAQAIMENPNHLLLDEPMNGLDNRGVEDMKTLYKNLRNQGKTIILASHHMEDITELCDTVSLMDDGRLTRQR